MRSKNYKANGHRHNLNLLINSHRLCVSYPVRSACEEKSIHLRHVYLTRVYNIVLIDGVYCRPHYTSRSTYMPTLFTKFSVAIRCRILKLELNMFFLHSVPGFEDDMDEIFQVEDGIFEDTHLNPGDETPAGDVGAVKGNSQLVPEEWRLAQEEMGQTKKQKKRVILDTLKERSKQKIQQRRKVKTGGEGTGHTPFPRVLPGDLHCVAIPDKSNEDFNDDGKLYSS